MSQPFQIIISSLEVCIRTLVLSSVPVMSLRPVLSSSCSSFFGSVSLKLNFEIKFYFLTECSRLYAVKLRQCDWLHVSGGFMCLCPGTLALAAGSAGRTQRSLGGVARVVGDEDCIRGLGYRGPLRSILLICFIQFSLGRGENQNDWFCV